MIHFHNFLPAALLSVTTFSFAQNATVSPTGVASSPALRASKKQFSPQEMEALVTALLNQEKDKPAKSLLEAQLPLALHQLVDHPQAKVGGFSAGEFARAALEFCANQQLKTGQHTLNPYWRNKAIAAGLNSYDPKTMAANTKLVDDKILTALHEMNTGAMEPRPAMILLVDTTHKVTLRPVDGLIEGYESVMEAVSPDRRVPVRPINDILKSEAKMVNAVDAMFSGTSNATVLDGYLAGIELAKLTIFREHPEFVKPGTYTKQAQTNAEILQLFKELDQELKSIKERIYSLYSGGHIKDSDLEAINVKEKALEQAKETADCDKITEAAKELCEIHQTVLILAREHAKTHPAVPNLKKPTNPFNR